MKIGILTHYSVNNQGAVLQMYALCKVIEQIGHEPFVLTYNKNFDFADEKTRKKYTIGFSSYPYFFKEYLLRQGAGITCFNVRKHRILSDFKKRSFRFQPYALFRTDAAIVGSDEVFSIPVGINAMMYGHGICSDRLVAYAPSFGQTEEEDISVFHCRELISSGLDKFQAISARDEHTRQLIEALCGRRAQIVCDPALLYDFTADPQRDIRGIRSPYLLVYSYDRSMNEETEVSCIRHYAYAHGLKTVSAGTYHKWCDMNIACDPLDWLEYFRHAQCCVVDTYHGLIAAAISGCPMAVKIRRINENKLSYLTRQLGLESRAMRNIETDLERILAHKMDFAPVDEKIKKLRAEGEFFLHDSLNAKTQPIAKEQVKRN